MLYPELARLLEAPSFIEALRDDYWLATNAAWCRMPDLVADEAAWWQVLRSAIPEFEEFALPDTSTGAAEYRSSIRLAALRTLAAGCGLVTQTFSWPTMLGGDAALDWRLSNGLPLRIGRISGISCQPTPSLVEFSLAILREPTHLAAIEAIFFPPVSDVANFPTHYTHWKFLEPLRRWNATNRLPLVPARAAETPLSRIYGMRYDEAAVAPTGISFPTAAQILAPQAAPIVRQLRSSDPSAEAVEPLILLAWALDRCLPHSGAEVYSTHDRIRGAA